MSPRHTLATSRLPLDQVDISTLLITDPDLLERYNDDQYTSLRGQATHLARPSSELELAALLAWAHHRRVPVTIVGRKTGFVGGATPSGRASHGGTTKGVQAKAGQVGGTPASTVTPYQEVVLALSTEKLIRLEVDVENHRATVGPGMLQGDLWRACARTRTGTAPHGLLYPPDPTSRDDASLGGGLACNASGARTFKYGMTRQWVLGLRVLLVTGELLELERGQVFFDEQDELELVSEELGRVILHRPSYSTPEGKHAAGYYSRPGMDLVDLFIGEEGTLGVITEARVRLTPQPPGRFQLMVAFGSWETAIDFVGMARELPEGERPAALEWMDGLALRLVRREQPRHALVNDPAVQAIVVMEVELPPEAADEGPREALTDELLMTWARRLEEHAPLVVLTATSATQMERFRQMRHAVPSTVNELVSRRGLFKLGTDTRVDFDRFQQYMAWAREHLAKLGVQGVSYGHAGDAHVHFNLLPGTATEVPAAEQAYHDLAARAVELGGTVSAEHGIGKVKHALLELQVGSRGIEEMKHLKARLDPHGILGPGNLFN